MHYAIKCCAIAVLAAAGCDNPQTPTDNDEEDHREGSLSVVIETTEETFQGSFEDISVSFSGEIDTSFQLGGFDFLLQYGSSALTLQQVSPGSFLQTCGWEYFTYRYGANAICGGAPCPSGVVRVVAIAEMNNGANYADCFASTTDTELFKLTFLVTNDRTYECTQIPVQFIWYDCGDNAIASKTGDTLFISRHVYDYPFDTIIGPIAIEDPDAAFPTNFGAPAVCETAGGPNKPEPLRLIDFTNGGIAIACADSIDVRGDINLDGWANTIADLMLFRNYFVYGTVVFTHDEGKQIAATDVNADGQFLRVADLVYLVRIVVGDALPYPTPIPAVPAWFTVSDTTISVESEKTMGGVFMILEGNVTPTLSDPQMELKFSYHPFTDCTRLLVWSPEGDSTLGPLLTFDIHPTILSIDAATAQGIPVRATVVSGEGSAR
ncbi:MAG: hypothetical protein PHE72_14105 [candidate division Zixibacteria bacterium]|nr:hypothetical protein [candidate division Zixibacteria bacterium]MDD4918926.1 hypothetical protein [candidate division Zixibacteria bacterium]MDM7972273.1 hypothetical protein [candidate division Zixibacteria bacterium]